ncbi:hypothetical protein [Kurthia sibirica]|uniref:Uncharacterized protein n=1 Tax=Kurthia sibirica TaxID=202750 RepID=A0A2U3AF07_9BACL|nr:hypothetical protein [Kurthia sibirica]PWI23123.1 hypothetical protein DEX24_16400 [Kurthia sibirica]GEK35545.1 hypothetical protein KSI01_30780 [Kurthia sibirica]
MRDRLLRKVHMYGGMLDIPYSTGYYYQCIVRKPWEKYQTQPPVITPPENGCGSNNGDKVEFPYDPTQEILDSYMQKVVKFSDKNIESLRKRSSSEISRINFEANMTKIPSQYTELTLYYRNLYNEIVGQ